MPETSPSDGAPKPVSMEDLKALEVTFKSSLDTQMREFQNMFLELKQGLIASPPLRTEESGPSLEDATAKAAAASPEAPGVDGILTKNHIMTLDGNPRIHLSLILI